MGQFPGVPEPEGQELGYTVLMECVGHVVALLPEQEVG